MDQASLKTEGIPTPESPERYLPLPSGFTLVRVAFRATPHYPGVMPLLLKTGENVYSPFRVWCPLCGKFVTSSTEQDAVDLWNSDLAASGPPVDSERITVDPPINIEWHHAGVSPVLYESTSKDLHQYRIVCAKCGLFLDGPEPLELINRWNAQMEAGPRCD